MWERASSLKCSLHQHTYVRLPRQPAGPGMTQDSDQGAGAMDSSWPSGVAVAAAPAAPVAASAMTVGGVLTVAGILTLFVLCALALVLLQYCFDAQGRRADTTPPSNGQRRRGGGGGSTRSRGVDPEVLRSMPVTVYRAAKDHATVECAVCLAELEDGEQARFLPRCGHGFHAECVDMWLASHSTCPLCRLTVGKPDEPPTPALALALPPVTPELANYAAANLPASVLLGVSDLRGAVTVTTGGGTSPSARATAVLVIEIPESAAPTPRGVAKSPGSARLRTIRRLWSFGRQGAGPSSSCSCGGAGEEDDVEQSISVTVGIAAADIPLPSEAAAGTTRPGAVA